MRAELPAEITGKMEDFMEKNACAAISRGALCGSNGDDGSKLRNPRGIGFKPEECRERLKQVCEELAPSATDDLIEAAMTGSAADCEDILPSGSCSAAVAQKLLGLDYQKGGTEGANFAPHRTTNLGVKDVWKKSARSQISHDPSDVQHEADASNAPCLPRASVSLAQCPDCRRTTSTWRDTSPRSNHQKAGIRRGRPSKCCHMMMARTNSELRYPSRRERAHDTRRPTRTLPPAHAPFTPRSC